VKHVLEKTGDVSLDALVSRLLRELLAQRG
jgi:hypothetical protein